MSSIGSGTLVPHYEDITGFCKSASLQKQLKEQIEQALNQRINDNLAKVVMNG